MPRVLLLSALVLIIAAIVAVSAGSNGTVVEADIGGVYSNVPVFGPGQPITITVTGEDDDGDLEIETTVDHAELTVTNCSGIGQNQVSGRCDGSGMKSVDGNGSTLIVIDTKSLDSDTTMEHLTITLTMIVDCEEKVVVTVSADQPGNEGPDDVTINCIPPTPTPSPTPTFTPSPTNTPAPTATAIPTATPPPPPPVPTPPPPAAPVDQVLTIRPPNTGSAGIR